MLGYWDVDQEILVGPTGGMKENTLEKSGDPVQAKKRWKFGFQGAKQILWQYVDKTSMENYSWYGFIILLCL